MRQSLYDDGVFQSGCTVDGVDASGATKKFQADEVLEFIEENGTFFASQNLLGEAYSDFSLGVDDTQEDFNGLMYDKFQDIGGGYSFTEIFPSNGGDDEITVSIVKIGQAINITVNAGAVADTFVAPSALSALIPAGNTAIEMTIDNPGHVAGEFYVSATGRITVVIGDGTTSFGVSYVSDNSTKLT